MSSSTCTLALRTIEQTGILSLKTRAMLACAVPDTVDQNLLNLDRLKLPPKLSLQTIDYRVIEAPELPAVAEETKEIYDWLTRVTGLEPYYLVLMVNIGWVKYEDTKMVEEFLAENYL
jgi:hypothetical protein